MTGTHDDIYDRYASVCQRLSALVDALQAVMSTLDKSGASPCEQRTYSEARALLAEHGCYGPPEEMRKAHEEWEGRR